MAPSVLQYGGKMGNKKSDETCTHRAAMSGVFCKMLSLMGRRGAQQGNKWVAKFLFLTVWCEILYSVSSGQVSFPFFCTLHVSKTLPLNLEFGSSELNFVSITIWRSLLSSCPRCAELISKGLLPVPRENSLQSKFRRNRVSAHLKCSKCSFYFRFQLCLFLYHCLEIDISDCTSLQGNFFFF